MPYGLQAQVYRHLRAARPLPGGRVLKRTFQAVWRHIVQINDETPWHLPLGQYHGDITRLIVCAMLFYFFIVSTTSVVFFSSFAPIVSTAKLIVSTATSTKVSTVVVVSTCTYLYIGLPFVLIHGIS